MAIFIIDQFSLNTDLPLDVRYVPASGRFDPDISIYKYPGMQVYDSSTESVWHTDNSLNWVEMGASTDASLNELIQKLNDVSILVDAHDISIGNLYDITNQLDASIIRIDASITDLYNSQAIQDVSIKANSDYNTIQDVSIKANDSSIIDLYSKINGSDSSISDLYNSQAIQDVSIKANTDYNTIQDVSIKANTDYNTIQDVSIKANSDYNTIQDASIKALDASLSAIEASLGDYVLKSGDTMTGNLTISSGGLIVSDDVSITGDLNANNGTFNGNLGVRGDFFVDGSTTFIDSTTLDISTNFIRLNTGLTGNPPEWLQSGIVVERGDVSSYAMIFDETDLTFRIGVVNAEDASGFSDIDTQAVATRQDSPLANGVAYWNESESRFDTNVNFTYNNTELTLSDASLILGSYAGATDLTLVVGSDGVVKAVATADSSISDIYDRLSVLDTSVGLNTTHITIIDSSITALKSYNTVQDVSIKANTDNISIIDSSITDIYDYIEDISTNEIKGAYNIGDGSAGVYSGTVDGSLQFREIVGLGSVSVSENGNLIEITGVDTGEANTTSNIGTGEGLALPKEGEDLPFKTISSLDPSTVIITSDNSTLYVDVSIAAVDTDVSISGITDTSINETTLNTHSNLEFNADSSTWENTNNIWWDNSLGTTTDDLGGIVQGSNLEGLTLKEILYKILYEYQSPILSVSSTPSAGIYEKGLVSTQFASVDINWNASNSAYPLALLNNVHISKTSSGNIYDASLGLVSSSVSSYTDNAGILNWGGVNRTVNYNVSIDDNQANQSQPAVVKQSSLTFYYKQFWGTVDGNTNIGQVDSALINGLSDNRLAGETDLTASYVNPGTGFIKYVFGYPDTVAAPDNFGLLSQIIDQNDFDLTDSFQTSNVDVSIGNTTVRYRVYLAKNKVTTSDFDITYKF